MSETKPCIACAEEIKAEAMLCRHCQTMQDDKSFKKVSPTVKKNPSSSPTEVLPNTSTYLTLFLKGQPIWRIIAGTLVLTPVLVVGIFLANGEPLPFTSPQINSQQVNQEPYLSYYMFEATDGSEAMKFALDALNFLDLGGEWEEDSFSSESPLVAGVLLDTYSEFPAGCAIWWFDNQEELLQAVGGGDVNLFSDSWLNFYSTPGPPLVIVANSYDDLCFQNAIGILELEMP
jgi:hypothetical protein